MLKYGMEKYHINELSVNEQNPEAKLFYEHLGFVTYKRTELDEQGNPFPILYMKKKVTRRQSRRFFINAYKAKNTCDA